jgi:hypothetical protein
MKLIVLIVTLAVGRFLAGALDTNELYVTDDGTLFLDTPQRKHMNPVKLEAAKTMRECLPAEMFPEGHWGPTILGYQLSLRFEKPAFTNGEPINANIIIRNTLGPLPPSQMLGYVADIAMNEDGWFLLSVTDAMGQPVDSKPINKMIPFSDGVWSLEPKTQRKYAEQLNNRYRLTNGTYYVEASIKMNYGRLVSENPIDQTGEHIFDKQITPDGKYQFEWFQLKSGKVKIEVK